MSWTNARHVGDKLILTGHKRVAVRIRLAPVTAECVLGPLEFHHHTVDFEVTISAKELEKMVESAFRNKSRRCKDGPASVRITNSTPIGVVREGEWSDDKTS